MLYVNIQIPLCCMSVQLSDIYHRYCKRKPYRTKSSLCTVTSQVYLHIVQSKISQEISKIFRYLYTETIKRRGKISLHRHFKTCKYLLMSYIPCKKDFTRKILQERFFRKINLMRNVSPTISSRNSSNSCTSIVNVVQIYTYSTCKNYPV